MYRPTPASMTNNFANPTLGSLVLTGTNGFVTLVFPPPSTNTWVRLEQPIEPATVR